MSERAPSPAQEATVRRELEEDAAAFRLRVTSGADGGLVLEIRGDEPAPLLIGQSEVCSLKLRDRQVSRRHAEVELRGGKLRLRDLGSTNGTFVEDVGSIEVLLVGGEHVLVGSTEILVERIAGARKAPAPASDGFGRFLGRSQQIRNLYPVLHRFAASDVPLVIEGETGTGKEVLAEAIHEASQRARGPYVVFDCTTAPPSLVESELYGHERGAFTNAVATRRGVFEQANGGTLLIDEIGDLDLALQAKLLRAIERSEVRRLGGDAWIRVDVRVIAATRRDLDREVQLGRFRDDLFHRLAVGRIELPPLRRREGDVRFLAERFFAELGGQGSMDAALVDRWEGDAWPGNVRELRNAVARTIALGGVVPPPTSRDTDVEESAETDYLAHLIEQKLPFPLARDQVLAEFERRFVSALLTAHGGNVAAAAAASGIGRRYFQMLRSRAGR